MPTIWFEQKEWDIIIAVTQFQQQNGKIWIFFCNEIAEANILSSSALKRVTSVGDYTGGFTLLNLFRPQFEWKKTNSFGKKMIIETTKMQNVLVLIWLW